MKTAFYNGRDYENSNMLKQFLTKKNNDSSTNYKTDSSNLFRNFQSKINGSSTFSCVNIHSSISNKMEPIHLNCSNCSKISNKGKYGKTLLSLIREKNVNNPHKFHHNQIKHPPKKTFKKSSSQNNIFTRPTSSFMRNLPFSLNDINTAKTTNNNNVNLPSILSVDKEELFIQYNNLRKKIRFLLREIKKARSQADKIDNELMNKTETINEIIYKNDSMINNIETSLFSNNETKINNNDSNASKLILNTTNNSLLNKSIGIKIKEEIKRIKMSIINEQNKINEIKKNKNLTDYNENNIEGEVMDEQLDILTNLYSNESQQYTAKKSELENLSEIMQNIKKQEELIANLNVKTFELQKKESNLREKESRIRGSFSLRSLVKEKNGKEIKGMKEKTKGLEENMQGSKMNINEYIKQTNDDLSYYKTQISDLNKQIFHYKTQASLSESKLKRLSEQKVLLLETRKNTQFALGFQGNSLGISQKLMQNSENLVKSQAEIEELLGKKNKKYKVLIRKKENLKEKYRYMSCLLRSILAEKFRENSDKNDVSLLRKIREPGSRSGGKPDGGFGKFTGTEDDNENENAQNSSRIEFGIDERNPYFSGSEDNRPEESLKFTPSQFNQFTYIFFKNFESKGIVGKVAAEKVLDEVQKIFLAEDVSKVDLSTERGKKIISKMTNLMLGLLGCDNRYNYKYVNCFLGALIFNAGGSVEKFMENLYVLFNYTRDYISLEKYFIEKLTTKYIKKLKDLIKLLKEKLEVQNKANNELDNEYLNLIDVKDIIDNSKLEFKDKYIEFIFYFTKKFSDPDSKLSDLKINLLDKIFTSYLEEEGEEHSVLIKDKIKSADDRKKEEKSEEFKGNVRDKLEGKRNEKEENRECDSGEEMEDEDSMTEITNEEYLKQIKLALTSISSGLSKSNKNLLEVMSSMIQQRNLNGVRYDCVTIEDFNDQLREINVELSDLQLSCLCSKFSFPNELRVLDVNKINAEI